MAERECKMQWKQQVLAKAQQTTEASPQRKSFLDEFETEILEYIYTNNWIGRSSSWSNTKLPKQWNQQIQAKAQNRAKETQIRRKIVLDDNGMKTLEKIHTNNCSGRSCRPSNPKQETIQAGMSCGDSLPSDLQKFEALWSSSTMLPVSFMPYDPSRLAGTNDNPDPECNAVLFESYPRCSRSPHARFQPFSDYLPSVPQKSGTLISSSSNNKLQNQRNEEILAEAQKISEGAEIQRKILLDEHKIKTFEEIYTTNWTGSLCRHSNLDQETNQLGMLRSDYLPSDPQMSKTPSSSNTELPVSFMPYYPGGLAGNSDNPESESSAAIFKSNARRSRSPRARFLPLKERAKLPKQRNEQIEAKAQKAREAAEIRRKSLVNEYKMKTMEEIYTSNWTGRSCRPSNPEQKMIELAMLSGNYLRSDPQKSETPCSSTKK